MTKPFEVSSWKHRTRLLICCWRLALKLLATLWAPLVQKWSLYERQELLRIGGQKVREKNGGQVQREPAVFVVVVSLGLSGYLYIFLFLSSFGHYRTK